MAHRYATIRIDQRARQISLLSKQRLKFADYLLVGELLTILIPATGRLSVCLRFLQGALPCISCHVALRPPRYRRARQAAYCSKGRKRSRGGKRGAIRVSFG